MLTVTGIGAHAAGMSAHAAGICAQPLAGPECQTDCNSTYGCVIELRISKTVEKAACRIRF